MSTKSAINAESIAKCALNHYNNLPGKKGKAKEGQEWTVYSAIIASKCPKSDPWVVSCATGLKCCPARNKCTKTNVEGGINLHDSHAEVLARRGLMRVLWMEIESYLKMKSRNDTMGNNVEGKHLTHNLLAANSDGTFELKDVSLHLYISDSPCGDASIYSLKQAPDSGTSLLFTGAKLVMNEANKTALDQAGGGTLLPCHTTTTFVAREHTQILAALRTKSGRSNLPHHLRCTSMSCSDKLCRWCILGLQGSLLSFYIPKPIILDSIVVSRDFRADLMKDEQLHALGRALTVRLQNVKQQLSCTTKDFNHSDSFSKHLEYVRNCNVSIYLVDAVYKQGKAYTDGIKLNQDCTKIIKKQKIDSIPHKYSKKISPSGISMNFQQNTKLQEKDSIEITIGSTGMKQKSYSRLSRYNFVRYALSCDKLSQNLYGAKIGIENSKEKAETYQELKNQKVSSFQKEARNVIFFGESNENGGPLKGWLCSSESNDFTIKHM